MTEPTPEEVEEAIAKLEAFLDRLPSDRELRISSEFDQLRAKCDDLTDEQLREVARSLKCDEEDFLELARRSVNDEN